MPEPTIVAIQDKPNNHRLQEIAGTQMCTFQGTTLLLKLRSKIITS